MRPVPGGARRGRCWLECRPRWTAPHMVRGHTIQVLVWRLALGWGGPAAGATALVYPLALVERRGTADRWRLVPDPTLAVLIAALAAAAWLVRGADPAAPPPPSAPHSDRRLRHG